MSVVAPFMDNIVIILYMTQNTKLKHFYCNLLWCDKTFGQMHHHSI